jgi:esterase/lipase
MSNNRSIQIFAEFTKQLLAEDPKFKDFTEVAKFIIKRAGQTDSVKMVALKGLAKIYEQLAKKDNSFSFSEDDAKIIVVDLEKDNLESQFKRIANLYTAKESWTVSLEFIQSKIMKLVS